MLVKKIYQSSPESLRQKRERDAVWTFWVLSSSGSITLCAVAEFGLWPIEGAYESREVPANPIITQSPPLLSTKLQLFISMSQQKCLKIEALGEEQGSGMWGRLSHFVQQSLEVSFNFSDLSLWRGLTHSLMKNSTSMKFWKIEFCKDTQTFCDPFCGWNFNSKKRQCNWVDLIVLPFPWNYSPVGQGKGDKKGLPGINFKIFLLKPWASEPSHTPWLMPSHSGC